MQSVYLKITILFRKCHNILNHKLKFKLIEYFTIIGMYNAKIMIVERF